ncbi:MAG: hypothetical protein XXXJIFNMEKO3_02546 [Candidatus Erwinia impunctatus]|nr:hypothetical protein XXXJIFNMEKO_02546 [Culicoides impunctatus]
MKQQYTTTVNVKGKGESKARAFADALSKVQQTVLKSTSQVLLRIDPLDVKVVQATQQVKREKFLFFFLARERNSFGIELEITISVTAIDTETVHFST